MASVAASWPSPPPRRDARATGRRGTFGDLDLRPGLTLVPRRLVDMDGDVAPFSPPPPPPRSPPISRPAPSRPTSNRRTACPKNSRAGYTSFGKANLSRAVRAPTAILRTPSPSLNTLPLFALSLLSLFSARVLSISRGPSLGAHALPTLSVLLDGPALLFFVFAIIFSFFLLWVFK